MNYFAALLKKGSIRMLTYIDEYTNYMAEVCHKSANTVESYRRDVQQYITYLKELGITDITVTTKTTVLTYLLSLKKKGRAASTLSRNLASLRSFYLYLVKNGDMKSDPTASLVTPHVDKKPPKVLSGEDIEKLLAQPVLTDNKGIRDSAMLELIYATGIRVSELIGLNVTDVNLEMGFIRCHNNKNERVIPMGNKAVKAVSCYISGARLFMLKSPNENALFVNCQGERISRQGFWKIIKQYQHSAGIDVEITPHSLRHSFAAHLVENGADLESLKMMMGHADISSTQIYTCFVNEKIRSVYEKAHPRA